jgi:hypothetical protein
LCIAHGALVVLAFFSRLVAGEREARQDFIYSLVGPARKLLVLADGSDVGFHFQFRKALTQSVGYVLGASKLKAAWLAGVNGVNHGAVGQSHCRNLSADSLGLPQQVKSNEGSSFLRSYVGRLLPLRKVVSKGLQRVDSVVSRVPAGWLLRGDLLVGETM